PDLVPEALALLRERRPHPLVPQRARDRIGVEQVPLAPEGPDALEHREHLPRVVEIRGAASARVVPVADHRLDRGVRDRDELGGDLVEQCGEDLLLGGEVRVEGAAGESGGGDQVVDRGAVDPLLDEHLERGADELGAGVLPAPCGCGLGQRVEQFGHGSSSGWARGAPALTARSGVVAGGDVPIISHRYTRVSNAWASRAGGPASPARARPGGPVSSSLYRLGRLMASLRWKIVGAWLVLLVIIGGLAVGLGGTFSSDIEIPGTEGQRGIDALATRFPEMGGTSGQVVFVTEDGSTVDEHQDEIDALMTEIGEVAHVSAAPSPFADHSPGTRADDDTAVIAQFQMDFPTGVYPAESVEEIGDLVDEADTAALDAHLGGQVLQSADIPFGAGEIIGVVVALIILAIVFRSL